MLFLQAVARQEGFYKPGSRPARNNNPGDLEYDDETIRFGATHGDPRFAVFADVLTGWKALQRWLSVPAKFDKDGNLVAGYLGAKVCQVIMRFAPPGGADKNDTARYILNVCALANVKPDTILTEELLAIPPDLCPNSQGGGNK